MDGKKRYKLSDYGIDPATIVEPIIEPTIPPEIEMIRKMVSNQYIPPTIGDRLPFLKNRGVVTNIPEKHFDEEGNIVTEGEPQEKDLTFQQRALNQINNLLLKTNLHDSQAGEMIREVGTPIVSGFNRVMEGMEQFTSPHPMERYKGAGNIGLGTGGALFGTFMSPFTVIRKGVEEMGGEEAGKIAELGSLYIGGGIPLVIGFLASQGMTDLEHKITEGMELTPKEQETVDEITGLTFFVVGNKLAGKTGKVINKKWQSKVEKYIDEIPEFKGDASPMNEGLRRLRNELVVEEVEKILETKEKIAKEKENVKIQKEAEKEVLSEKVKEEQQKIQELKPKEKPKTKREILAQEKLDANTKAINEILDKDPSISNNPRQISQKLNTLLDKGKLKSKVSINTIKEIADEWAKNRPKPKVQEVKTTPIEERTIPNFWDKNAHAKVSDLMEEFPEVDIKGKSFEQIRDEFLKAKNEKYTGVIGEQPKGKESNFNVELVKETPLETEIKKSKEVDFNKKVKEEFPDEIGKAIDEIFAPKKGRILTEEEYKKRKLNQRKRGFYSGINPTDLSDLIYIGAYHLETGVRNFAKWSDAMVRDLGEKVKPHLEKIWKGLNKHIVINDKKVKDWIKANKNQLGLELRKIEGKIIDPNTGLEGGARHLAGRDKSIIEYNENTAGSTWYHELSHVINRLSPEILKNNQADIEKLIGRSRKPLNEQFADAFVEIYTNPKAPRTKLASDIAKKYQIPKSFDLTRSQPKNLGYQELPEREPGKRKEFTYEELTQKFDASEDVTKQIFDTRGQEEYKKLRNDGTQTFEEAVKEADRYQNLTEENLLTLDPRTLNGKTFNKAQQIRIDQIALNKALKVTELRKSFGEQLSTEQALRLNQELSELMKLQALAKNNLREAARVLESAKRKHKLTPQEYELLQEVANEIGKKDFKSLDKITDPSLKDKALYWWYNSILSNPLTDMANIVGNATNLGFEIIRQPLSLLNGSLFRGIKEGYLNAKRVWEGQQEAISKFSDRAMKLRDILQTKSKWGTRIKNTLLPTSRLAIEDAFFRSIFETMREEKQAKLTAKETGVTAQEIIEIYTDILKTGESKNKLVTELGTERFEKEVNAIERYANKMVFQKELGTAGRYIQNALNKPVMLPVKLLALPFLRIAINLSKVSAEASPFGLLKLLKRAEYKELTKLEKQDIYNRAIAGTVFYLGMFELISQEMVEITGEAPRDKNIRDLWYKAGYEPFSVVINNSDGTKTVIPYQNVSPINIVLGAIGTMMTDAKYGKSADDESVFDKAIKGVLGFVKAIGNQSFLQGTSQLLTAIENTNEKTIRNSLVRMTTPNLFSLFQGQADLGEGKYIYQTESLLDQYKTRLGITGDLKTKPDVFGEDLRSTYRRFPIPREREVNEIADFLLRTGNVIGDPQNPKRQGESIYSDEQYNEYKRYYRRNMYKLLNHQLELLKKIEKQGELGTKVISKLIRGLKERARTLAKITIEEKQ